MARQHSSCRSWLCARRLSRVSHLKSGVNLSQGLQCSVDTRAKRRTVVVHYGWTRLQTGESATPGTKWVEAKVTARADISADSDGVPLCRGSRPSQGRLQGSRQRRRVRRRATRRRVFNKSTPSSPGRERKYKRTPGSSLSQSGAKSCCGGFAAYRVTVCAVLTACGGRCTICTHVDQSICCTVLPYLPAATGTADGCKYSGQYSVHSSTYLKVLSRTL